MRTRIIPVVIGSLGAVSGRFKDFIHHLKLRWTNLYILQKFAILGIASILRKTVQLSSAGCNSSWLIIVLLCTSIVYFLQIVFKNTIIICLVMLYTWSLALKNVLEPWGKLTIYKFLKMSWSIIIIINIKAFVLSKELLYWNVQLF